MGLFVEVVLGAEVVGELDSGVALVNNDTLLLIASEVYIYEEERLLLLDWLLRLIISTVLVCRVFLILKRLLIVGVDYLLLVLILPDLVTHDIFRFVLERFLSCINFVTVLLMEWHRWLYLFS